MGTEIGELANRSTVGALAQDLDVISAARRYHDGDDELVDFLAVVIAKYTQTPVAV